MEKPKHSLRNLFAEALEISDATERAAFLDRECGADGNLRRKVELLIQAEEAAGHFLPEKPAITSSDAALREFVGVLSQNVALPRDPLIEETGDRIDRYRLLEKIGEGGCGVVYMAEQTETVRRRVALKVIKLGMDTQSVVARFDAERQALALMDHANIAKVFDAGATDKGRPFFVMELVRGARITDYCGRHQLSTRARLELFIQVCQAVQHAHQKGIIHRDLKPSNILVTGGDSDSAGVPKVIDFGIAKATQGKLTDQTLFTAFEQFLGTPAYMSPEQAAMTNVDIDTRSDIYSLGVLLYELLTGNTPFDTKELLALGVDELRRTIREKDPVRPSTRLRQTNLAASPTTVATRHSALAADLDWIVMKCLEKDRNRRYETANGLAADLRRHLHNEPVVARPQSRLYEFQKTVRRHRVGFAATAAVIVALVAGVIGSTWQAFRAMRAEEEQLRLRQQAQAERYTSDMNLALQAWEEGNLKRAQALLQAHIPNRGEPDLRGFEWCYLWKLCQDQSLQTVKFGADNPVGGLGTSPAHSFVAVACDKTIRLLEPLTGRELVRFTYPNPDAPDSAPVVALAAGMTNLLAAHRAEGVVGLWDVARRELLITFKPLTNEVGALALSPDGRLLAAVESPKYSAKVLTVWDISLRPQPPSLVWSYQMEQGMPALAFSPDGQLLVTVSGSHTNVVLDTFNAMTGRELNPISNISAGNINAIAFSPDGTLLASSGVEGRINIWNFTNRTWGFHFDGHAGSVTSLAFSADGTRLVSGGIDGTIRQWDIASRKDAGLWRAPRGGHDLKVEFSPEGKSLVSGARDEVKIWKPEPQEPAVIIKVQPGWGWPIVSPDSKSLIVTSLIHPLAAAVWDIASGQHKFDLVCKCALSQTPAFSPDGRLFAIGDIAKEGLVSLWETADWEKGAPRLDPVVYLTNGFEAGSICFSPDGKILAVAGLCFPPETPKELSGATNRLAFWEVGSWRKLDLLPGAGAGATEWAAAATAAFSSDERLLAVGSRNGWVHLWDFKHERQLKEFKAHDNFGWGARVMFSPDNRWLASYSVVGPSVVLFDVADLEHSRPLPLSQEELGIHWALFTPDNKSLVTASNDGLIKFWNLQTRSVALTLRHGHGPGGSLAFSPDGILLVSTDANGTVKIWPAATLAEIPKFKAAEREGGSK